MKEYKILEEKINEEKQITTMELKKIGFSEYDIKQFLEAGILKRVKRGLYEYTVEPSKEDKNLEEIKVPEENGVDNHFLAVQCINRGINKIIKRVPEESVELFNQALALDNTNFNARTGLIGAYVFQEDYQTAFFELKKAYEDITDDNFLTNVYYYTLLLSEFIDIDDNFIEEVRKHLIEAKDNLKKPNSNIKKLFASLENKNYEEALKYANYTIHADKQNKKYHLAIQIYRYLIVGVLKKKDVNNVLTMTHPSNKSTTSEDCEPRVIIPTEAKETIKVNLLVEAINNNDYQKALSLLESEQIEKPVEVIKSLLTKLAMIQSLINSKTPLKVVDASPVTLIAEDKIEASLPSEEEQPLDSNTLSPKLEQSIPMVSELQPGETLEKKDLNEKVVPTKLLASVAGLDESNKQEFNSEPTKEELISLAYEAYKIAFSNNDFAEALKNLRRYDYLLSNNAQKRNLNYLYIRIEKNKNDYESNRARYFKKKELSKKIIQLKKERNLEAALEAIAEYKALGGERIDSILLIEAEIYLSLNNYNEIARVLKTLSCCEEPTYFILKSKLDYKNRNYKDAILACQAFNERCPNTLASNYQLMGECYTRIFKSGKAIKAYRKAEEVSRLCDGGNLDLSSKIQGQEYNAEIQKEERIARQLAKK